MKTYCSSRSTAIIKQNWASNLWEKDKRRKCFVISSITWNKAEGGYNTVAAKEEISQNERQQENIMRLYLYVVFHEFIRK